jgi:hypothetical protein
LVLHELHCPLHINGATAVQVIYTALPAKLQRQMAQHSALSINWMTTCSATATVAYQTKGNQHHDAAHWFE